MVTVNNNFEDKSDYIYRNSSTKKGGGRGYLDRTTTNTNLNIDGSEDVARDTQALLAADRTLLRNNIATIHNCALDRMCGNADTLEDRANYAWNRAVALYPTMQALLADQLEALRLETIQRICLAEYQWNRIAGSSLNCQVAAFKSEAESLLATRLAGVMAEALEKYKIHESQTISQAFADNLAARTEPSKIIFAHVTNLWEILKGSEIRDVTDRDYAEQRDEDVSSTKIGFELYYEALSIADNSGTYAGDVDDAWGLAQAAAGP